MNLSTTTKLLASLTLAAAGLAAAPLAEARPDVYVSIGFQSGPAWVEPAPVYVRPRPVYVQPVPVYVRPPHVYQPPCRDRYDAHREWHREHGWRRAGWHRHERHEGYRSNDRDPYGHGQRY